MLSGIGTSLWLVFTPEGAYMLSPNFLVEARRSISDGRFWLRVWFAEFCRQCARRGADLVAHHCDVIVAGAHRGCRGTDGADDSSSLIADRSTDANYARQEFL